MFHYKIIVRTKHGRDTRASRRSFHQFLKPDHAGEYVGAQLGRPQVTSVAVTKISAASYQQHSGKPKGDIP